MNRRSVLKLIGLAPLAPVLVKEALAKPLPVKRTRAYVDAMRVASFGQPSLNVVNPVLGYSYYWVKSDPKKDKVTPLTLVRRLDK